MSRKPCPAFSRWAMRGGTICIIPTSVMSTENSLVEDRGSNEEVEDRMASEAASNPRNGCSSSIALGVGRSDRPTRTNSGSPKWTRSLASILLTDDCVVSRICAARVRLPTSSSRLRTLKCRRPMSSSSTDFGSIDRDPRNCTCIPIPNEVYSHIQLEPSASAGIGFGSIDAVQ